jgi:hypothetical protein
VTLFVAPPIDLGAVRGGLPNAALAFTYSAFTAAPPAEWLPRYREAPLESQAGLLANTLDGNLAIVVDGQVCIEEEYFPLFRLAGLLAGWPRYAAGPQAEADIILDDYEHQAKLMVARQDELITLRWPVPTRWWPAEPGISQHLINVAAVPETDFNAASQAFIQQLQQDVAAHFGIDIGPLLPPNESVGPHW